MSNIRAKYNATPPTVADDQWTDLQVDANGNLKVAATDSQLANVVAGDYETVAASQTDQALGATGAAGDYLARLVCVVDTAATDTVSIKDGSGSAINVLPNNTGNGIGTYVIELGITSLDGAWKITTGAGVTVVAIGNFT